jgi:hypothetical protein
MQIPKPAHSVTTVGGTAFIPEVAVSRFFSGGGFSDYVSVDLLLACSPRLWLWLVVRPSSIPRQSRLRLSRCFARGNLCRFVQSVRLQSVILCHIHVDIVHISGTEEYVLRTRPAY